MFKKGGSKRRVQFQCTLHLHSLTDVPISGYVLTKFAFKNNKCKGKFVSETAPVDDGIAMWNVKYDCMLTFTVNSDTALLHDLPCTFKVRSQRNLHSKSRHSVGEVTINLASFACHRYTSCSLLLDQCKINSILVLNVSMHQVLGDPTFRCPDLPADCTPLPPPEENGDTEQQERASASSARSPGSGHLYLRASGGDGLQLRSSSEMRAEKSALQIRAEHINTGSPERESYHVRGFASPIAKSRLSIGAVVDHILASEDEEDDDDDGDVDIDHGDADQQPVDA